MNNLRKFLVLGLAVLLAVVSLAPATFSWYNHNGTQAGQKMNYTRNDLPVSNGTVSMQTWKLKKDPKDSTLLYYDEKGQKQTEGNPITTASVGVGEVQYFLTKFTNSSSSAAMANLYLTNYTNEPGLYLGTIYPTITEKNQAGQASKTQKSNGVTRVYFEDRDTTGWKNSENVTLYAVANGKKIEMTRTDKNEKNGAAVSRGTENSNWVYQADLPAGTTEFYFYSSMGDNNVSDGWYRTRTVTNIKAGTIYYLTGNAMQDDTNNAEMNELSMDNLIKVSKYYETITISTGQQTNISLSEGDFTGESIAYSIVAGSGTVTLNQHTNILTRDNTNSDATLRTTITGALGDTYYVDTVITTPTTLDSVPVVMNVKVPDKDNKVNEFSEEKEGTREVVWYIRNDGNQSGTFEGVFFTK